MFTTIGGNLTPTAPVYGDMRADVTLDVTTEEPLIDLPAAVGSMDKRENIHRSNAEEREPTSNTVSSATEVPETSPKVLNVESNQESSLGRNAITRETSREDALATSRHFFHTINKQRNVPEVPVTSATGVSQIHTVNESRNIPEVPVTSTTSVSQLDTPLVPPDHIETEPTEPGTTSPRVYLPSGSTPRPTATATCRPRTWV